jgi:hypothetical protein
VTWRAAEFRDYFLKHVGKETSASSYATNLRKLDAFTGGLDERIQQTGFAEIIEWARGQTEGPFEGYNASNVRSALNRYVKFLIDASDPEAVAQQPEETTSDEEVEATLFRYERELQVAVRRQIDSLEPGLVIADGGVERSVATGKIDVLAKDEKGDFVVIELKAGTCPSGALEQVLGYSEDLQQETGTHSRAVLIASDFPERLRSAARRVNDLKLITYKIQLAFEPDA